MHKLVSRWRLLVALVPVAAFLALIVGGGAIAPNANAAIATLPAAVTCSEFYLDLDNNGVGEDINGDTIVNTADITAVAISRLEPTQPATANYNITSVLYLGPDTPADSETLIPNEPPDQGCLAARTEATGGVEVSNTNPRLEYSNQFGTRPSSVPVSFTSKVLTTRTCDFSEAIGAWIRQDSFVTIAGTGPTSINDVDAVLYLATGQPSVVKGPDGNSATDPTTCATGSSFPYHTVGKSYGRDARTDNTALGKNVTNSIAADPSGAGLGDTADGLSDDYDGDGCTDWDELDKNFTLSYSAPASTNQKGMDPFNPYDCDQNINSNISMLMRVAKDDRTTPCTLTQILTPGSCVGSGIYFHCLGKISHTKSGAAQPLTFALGCYPDSTIQVVNSAYVGGQETCPPAAAGFCGDGRAGPAPPGDNRFISVLSANWPIPATGTYTTATGKITVGGCFVGLGGAAFGPNVYADGFIDLRTGAGEMDLFGKIQDVADCQNGSPFPSQSPVLNLLDVEIDMVEIGNKASAHDSDSDGCSDSEELGTNEAFGGKRDPFNEGDWFDPDGNGVIDLFEDIFGVAGKFGLTSSDPGYSRNYDRAAGVPGSNVWNITPPNGVIDLFDDIFGVAFMFGHDCSA